MTVTKLRLGARQRHTSRAPSSAPRARAFFGLWAFLAGEAGPLGACSHFSNTLRVRIPAVQARRAVAAGFLLLLAAPLAQAQDEPPADPADDARIHLGPLAMNTTVELKNLGIDNNVFNSHGEPQRDFTFTLGPKMDAYLRMRAIRLTLLNNQEYVFYKKFKNEQSANNRTAARLEVGLPRLRPFLVGEQLRTRERPDREIDLRAHRSEKAWEAGTSVALNGRTSFLVTTRRETFTFLEGEAFRAVALDKALNRRAEKLSVAARYVISPATTFVQAVERQHDRFLHSPFRDSDSTRVMSTFEFSPRAVFRGRASFGFRKLTPVTSGFATYSGIVAQVDAGYTLLDHTKFDLVLNRDTNYAFEPGEPYYVGTGGTLRITQHVLGPFAVVLVGGRHGQDYDALERSPTTSRHDTVSELGLGFEFSKGKAKFGLVIQRDRRRSNDPLVPGYQRTQAFTTVNLGL